ncbi:single-stranded DNA-binding protein [Variovorax sp. PBS-H4]|uniref:single-stranded DNA-binding protein n=1 Tax=Variovorax sp. PBS-H4 TaxID=434008 RepID=UPI003FCCE209
MTTAPTLRTVQRSGGQGYPVANFMLSVRDRRRRGGEWIDLPEESYDVAVYGDAGRRAAAVIRIGDRVVVAGTVHKEERPDTRDWADPFNRHLEADHVGLSTRFMTPEQRPAITR